MKKYTKIYLDHFEYSTADFIPCEACTKQAVDIHHIEARGMGGRNRDNIYNLMALCRDCHIEFGDKKQHKDFLTYRHIKKINGTGKHKTAIG